MPRYSINIHPDDDCEFKRLAVVLRTSPTALAAVGVVAALAAARSQVAILTGEQPTALTASLPLMPSKVKPPPPAPPRVDARALIRSQIQNAEPLQVEGYSPEAVEAIANALRADYPELATAPTPEAAPEPVYDLSEVETPSFKAPDPGDHAHYGALNRERAQRGLAPVTNPTPMFGSIPRPLGCPPLPLQRGLKGLNVEMNADVVCVAFGIEREDLQGDTEEFRIDPDGSMWITKVALREGSLASQLPQANRDRLVDWMRSICVYPVPEDWVPYKA